MADGFQLCQYVGARLPPWGSGRSSHRSWLSPSALAGCLARTPAGHTNTILYVCPFVRNLEKHCLGAKTMLFFAVWETQDLFYARKRWFDLFHCLVSIPVVPWLPD